jgi:hypothetical protein
MTVRLDPNYLPAYPIPQLAWLNPEQWDMGQKGS